MVKKKIIHRIIILGAVLVVLLTLVVISLDNYYHDYLDLSLYESPKIFKEYREHQSDFHYTMNSNTEIPKKLQLYTSDNSQNLFRSKEIYLSNDSMYFIYYYFNLEYNNHADVKVVFPESTVNYDNQLSRSFFVDLSELGSDQSAYIDIISASCIAAESSLTIEQANEFAWQLLQQPNTKIDIGNYVIQLIDCEDKLKDILREITELNPRYSLEYDIVMRGGTGIEEIFSLYIQNKEEFQIKYIN